jgi:hypothetical protein
MVILVSALCISHLCAFGSRNDCIHLATMIALLPPVSG